MTENNNLVTSTQGIIKEALHKLGFDDGMYDLIKEPLRFLQVRIPVRMDDGTVKTLLDIVHIMTLLDLLKVGYVSTQKLMKKKLKRYQCG